MKERLTSRYLQPEVLSQVESLELRAKLVVEGFITGLHKSPFHGFSVEFSQHRQYNPGDSLRFIDWKVLGRTDRYYIKQYEEETNLKANILIDFSNSMSYGSDGISKLDYARYLAAALSYLMLLQRDAVGLVIFDELIRKMLPPRSVTSYLQPMLHELDAASPGNDTNISKVLHEMAERIRRRGLIILISDLLDEPEKILSGLRHFRHSRHEVLVFHVLDPREIDFEFSGDVEFEDLESHEKIRTFPWYVRQDYQQKMNEFINYYRQQCREYKIDYQLLDTKTAYNHALSQYLVKRKQLR